MEKRNGYMKNKLVSWALTLCMLATMIAYVPQAAPTAKAADDTYPCTGGVHDGWTAVSSAAGFGTKSGSGTSAYYLLNGGNYYLDADVAIDCQLNISGTVTLCLNGRTLSGTHATGYRSYYFIQVGSGCTFNLCDCMGGGKLTLTTTPSQGAAAVHLENATSTFNFYGGTITNFKTRHGVIYAAGNVNMYKGAEITKNDSITLTASSNNSTVYVSSDSAVTFNMHGGTISDNTSTSGAVHLYKANNVFNMYDGTISDNTISNANKSTPGAAVKLSASGSAFNMYGGTIENNTFNRTNQPGAGAVLAAVNGALFNMYGGTIRNNSSIATSDANYAGTLRNSYSNDNFVLYGGTVTPDDHPTTSTRFAFRGSVSYPFTVDGAMLRAGGASSGVNDINYTDANVDYDVATSTLTVKQDLTSLTWDKANADFTPTIELGANVTADWLNTVAAGETVNLDLKGHTFTVGGGGNITNEGTLNIYDSVGGGSVVGTVNGETLSFAQQITLTEDTVSAELATIDAGSEVVLDLNGFTYTVTGGVINNAGSLTIQDSSAEGNGVLLGYVTNTGAGALTQTGGVMKRVLTGNVGIAAFDMDLGIDAVIDLNGFALTNTGASQFLYVYGKLTLQDTSEGTPGTLSNFRIRPASGGIFTLASGKISGCSGASGGAAYVDNGGTFNMSGGEISGNTATSTTTGGGGLQIVTGGTFNMSGGEITANHACRGGGVYVNGGTFNMSGGTITANVLDQGTSSNQSGNGVAIYTPSSPTAASKFIMTGGTVTGGGTGNMKTSIFCAAGTSDYKAQAYIYDGTVGAIGQANSNNLDVCIFGGKFDSLANVGTYTGKLKVYGGEFKRTDYGDFSGAMDRSGEDLVVKDLGAGETYRYQVVHDYDQQANMKLSKDLTFYMQLNGSENAWQVHSYDYTEGKDEATSRTPATATVTMPGRAAFDVEAELDSETDTYKIPVPVYAKEMADTITVKVKDSDGEVIETFTDSVKAYAERILADSVSAAEKALMVDMLNYGTAAQQYFGYDTTVLANAGLTGDQAALATVVTLAQDADTFNHPPAYHSANLKLDTDIDFNMYFWPEKINSTDLSYTIYKNGEFYGSGTFSKKLGNVLYEVNIEGVTLADIGGAIFEIKYTDDSENEISAKDTLPNYLARNVGLARTDVNHQEYQIGSNGNFISVGAMPTPSDTSGLYAKVQAFAASAAAYAAL